MIAPFILMVSMLGGGLPYAVASQGTRGRTNTVESTGILMAIGLGGLASLLLLGWSRLFASRPDTAAFVVAASCLPAAILVALFLEYERQRGAGARFNTVRLTIGLVSAASSVLLMLADVTSIVAYVIAIVAPNIVVLAVLVGRNIGIFGVNALSFNRSAAKAIWRSASRAWPSAVTDTLLLRADQVVLVLLVAPATVGMYAVAATVAESGGLLRHALVATYYERLAAADASAVGQLLRALYIRLLTLTLPVYVLMAVAVDATVPLLLGDSFVGSTRLVIVLLAAQVALDFHLTSGTVLLARNQPGRFSQTSSIALAVHVVLLIPAVISYGAVGACYASLVGYGCAAILTHLQTTQLVRNPVREGAA